MVRYIILVPFQVQVLFCMPFDSNELNSRSLDPTVCPFSILIKLFNDKKLL